ncbi:hypothetical protein FRACYDRAFT_242320 [Fragilariopsis cylindrus CCMP1102]|uniref:Uncharacterized protein n=1 Tax=Fragilariopsis cylindrus CCMP1102 TaxID=635003 RepID=A0A1E7F744_9STRA|nr:hypothetical protein FRACYDRAFT_242320 [Fragilariopsis cylindrus CCMP1102]|eukprot:OEU13967.1 hypothetical protein FRACYDRAFT_242320 [Fragilariopsis cylindrus CCMP1102]
MTQAKKMDDSKCPSTNDIDSERYKARKVKSTMEYVNLWNYYKVYGNSWSVISRECYQSKIKRDALRQRFGGGAFRKFLADKYDLYHLRILFISMMAAGNKYFVKACKVYARNRLSPGAGEKDLLKL